MVSSYEAILFLPKDNGNKILYFVRKDEEVVTRVSLFLSNKSRSLSECLTAVLCFLIFFVVACGEWNGVSL